MPTFEDIKRYYDLGIWTAEMVRKAVDKGIITEEQYKEIVEVDG